MDSDVREVGKRESGTERRDTDQLAIVRVCTCTSTCIEICHIAIGYRK